MSKWSPLGSPQLSSHIVPPHRLTVGLVYSQNVQYLLHEPRIEVTTLATRLCSSLGTLKRENNLVITACINVGGSWLGTAYSYLWSLGEVVNSNHEVSVTPAFQVAKGGAMSMAIGSNGAWTLHWCIGLLILVRGLHLSEQMSHCCHHLSTSLLECNQ